MSYTYDYPRPAVTVDAIIFDPARTRVLLIKRANVPFKNRWAFPGGFLDMDETADAGVRRELQEETGISEISLKQFHTFTAVDRDPRGRVLSITFVGTAPKDIHFQPADDASDVRWFDLGNLPALAFDHAEILKTAVDD